MKTNKRHTIAAKQGYLLGSMLVAMLVFSMVLVGLLNRTQAKAVEVADRVNKRQALWASEAAINQVIRRLELDATYRANPTDIQGSLNLIDYEVKVTKNGTEYVIEAKTMARQPVQVEQTVEASPISVHETFHNHAVFIEDGNLSVGDDAYVKGEIWKPLPIDADPIDPSLIPSMPILDTEYYKTLIDQASTFGISSPPADLVLQGDAFVDGTHSFTSISGQGRLIVSHDVKLKAGATIGPDIEIIAGHDLTLEDSVSAGKNVVLFAPHNLTAGKYGSLEQGAVLIGVAKVDILESSLVKGVVWSGGTTLLKAGARVYGSVASAGDVSLGEDAGIAHDPSQFPVQTAEGLQPSEQVEALTRSWTEL